MAQLTRSLAALRSAFNERFRDRDKATDGWIGDDAHKTTVSGHNPDDTPGVRAEYQDSDTKQEVRALDVDDDLRDPEITMQDVIDAILATPDDRDRLRYIIYNRHIWSASNNWRRDPYNGSNPHTSHGHFSGNPNADENDAPWRSVLEIGGGSMAGITAAQLQRALVEAGYDLGDFGPKKDGVDDDWGTRSHAALVQAFKAAKAPGPRGPAGPAGPPGPAGPQGPAGPAGRDGIGVGARVTVEGEVTAVDAT